MIILLYGYIIRRHRINSVHKMRPIATDGIAWSVGLSFGHVRKPCENGWTDRDAVFWDWFMWVQGIMC